MRLALYVLLFATSIGAFGQSVPRAKCDSSFEYVNHNQLDYRLKVRTVAVQVVDTEGVSIPNACVGLFDAESNRLAAVVETDDQGEARFGDLKPGKYRLIVADPQQVLCPVNAILVVGHVGATHFYAHMGPHGLDSCSWCDTKPTKNK